jgi:hypothetical protein
MSLQVLDTIASLITVTIVAVTAIAALVQLRHLRAGNQVDALISVGEKLDRREFTDALALANSSLNEALADRAYRDYEVSIFRRLPPPQVEQRYVDMHHAVVLVGNTFDLMGLLVKNQIVDANIFLDQYCGIATGSWKVQANYTALGREATASDTVWENFEYLAVLSEDWMRRNPRSYPRGVRRLDIHSPWPVPPTGSTSAD